MRFNAEDYRKLAKKDFEQAWHRGAEILTPPGVSETYPRKRYLRATPHPIAETVQRLREVYLSMGFDEASVPVMIEEQDVYRQFGPEASAVLDRVFYLGGLPRPNVGIGKRELDRISEIIGSEVPEETEEGLRKTLHAYKTSEIDGDDLTHALAVVLNTDDALVLRVMDEVFPEFRALAPESSRTTLRSHMTSGWFISLGAMWDKVPLPVRQFSIDRCFRREQEEGPTRLMTYHSASCIIAGEDVTTEDGMAVSEALLSAFGFTDFEFRPDEKRSKYYIPDTQTEVYARHPVHDWVEVATFGMYSPSALAEYGIEVPVMNLGLGVERLSMIEYQADDVRKLTHPQFFPREYTDRELAQAVGLREEPVTVAGKLLARAVIEAATKHAAAESPCVFDVWEGEMSGFGTSTSTGTGTGTGTRLKVTVEEPEENSKLCGPACFNDIFVHNGKIVGVPDTEKFAKVRKNGVPVGISYISAVANLAAARIEEAARVGEGTVVQVKMVKIPSEVNLKIEPWAMRYITDNNKKIDVRGPVFMTVRGEVV
ncbi:MAG: O-phosphoserine--tRNA ligase [Euryarchaeota archaeon]|nr:O-phosphoserine--tRNA ligase [Euryarchaeota archaeon]